MQSLQSGRYQMVATNNGITAIINAKGEIIAKAPAFKPAVLTGMVQGMKGMTPWVYVHNLL
jgi:apolipoprotein N-acyltransferase